MASCPKRTRRSSRFLIPWSKRRIPGCRRSWRGAGSLPGRRHRYRRTRRAILRNQLPQHQFQLVGFRVLKPSEERQEPPLEFLNGGRARPQAQNLRVISRKKLSVFVHRLSGQRPGDHRRLERVTPVQHENLATFSTRGALEHQRYRRVKSQWVQDDLQMLQICRSIKHIRVPQRGN